MKVVKITDAKNNLSRHLAYVRRGGRIRIVDRNVAVADLVPVEPTAGADDDASYLAALEREGIVRCGQGGPLPKEPASAERGGRKSGVLAALLDERRTGR